MFSQTSLKIKESPLFRGPVGRTEDAQLGTLGLSHQKLLIRKGNIHLHFENLDANAVTIPGAG